MTGRVTDTLVDILTEKTPSTQEEWRKAYDEMHALLALGYRPTFRQMDAVHKFIEDIPDEQSLGELFKGHLSTPTPAEVLDRVHWKFGPVPGISDHEVRPDLIVWAPKDSITRNNAWERARRIVGPVREESLRKCHTEHYWVYYVYDADTGSRVLTRQPPTLAEVALETFDPTCKHPRLTIPIFDEVTAHGLTPDEVRERWPRSDEECPDCGSMVIGYASFIHFVAGDW